MDAPDTATELAAEYSGLYVYPITLDIYLRNLTCPRELLVSSQIIVTMPPPVRYPTSDNTIDAILWCQQCSSFTSISSPSTKK